LAFSNTAGNIAVYPPLNTEVSVSTVSAALVLNNRVKVDSANSLSYATTANYSLSAESRLYRNGVLIESRPLNRSGSGAGTQSFTLSDTFVDTAPATATTTYEIRVITTAATNVTSGTASVRNINLLIF
jgi:hypothetical protein